MEKKKEKETWMFQKQAFFQFDNGGRSGVNKAPKIYVPLGKTSVRDT